MYLHVMCMPDQRQVHSGSSPIRLLGFIACIPVVLSSSRELSITAKNHNRSSQAYEKIVDIYFRRMSLVSPVSAARESLGAKY